MRWSCRFVLRDAIFFIPLFFCLQRQRKALERTFSAWKSCGACKILVRTHYICKFRALSVVASLRKKARIFRSAKSRVIHIVSRRRSVLIATIFCLFTFTGSCKTRSTNGNCCVFPFIYRGKRYNTCTRANSRRLWCSNTPNYDTDKMFGYCRGTGTRMFSFSFECLVLVLQLLRVGTWKLYELSFNYIRKNGFHTKEENERFTRHNLKFESCTTSFGRYVK